MDSITHTLYKAVAAADAAQRADALEQGRATLGAAVPGDHGAGLQPLASRPDVHKGYADAFGTDLHIELPGGPDLLSLWFELTNAGLAPPNSLITDGATVILTPGEVEVFVTQDSGQGTWAGRLETPGPGRRAEWKKEVV